MASEERADVFRSTITDRKPKDGIKSSNDADQFFSQNGEK
jgi:hypothetical protein